MDFGHVGSPPQSYTRPSWPSLYNPGLEILGIEHKYPVQPGGEYLYEPFAIFQFTLYWSLILHLPLFVLCGTYAFFNLTFPPSRNRPEPSSSHDPGHGRSASYASSGYPLTAFPTINRNSSYPTRNSLLHRGRDSGAFAPPAAIQSSVGGGTRPSPPAPRIIPPRSNEGRSRLTFALLVFLLYLALSVLNSVIGAAVVGYVLVGLFTAGGWVMSTWVPFVWAIITVLLGAIGIWPSIIDII